MSAIPARPHDVRKLSLATLAAAGIAGLVLLVAILPAEYGIDPTGLGRALGFTALSDEAPAPVIETPAEDEGPSALYELRAAWRLVELPIASRDGFVSLADTEERVTIPLAIANLTSVTATLAWNDADRIDGQITEGDTLEISLRGPGGLRSQLVQAKNEPGRPANATATLSLLSVPFPRENATGGLLIPTAEDTRGVGNWTFVVRLYGAGGVNGSAERDPGQSWTLTVTGEAYELDVRKQADRAGDRVRVTLGPKQGVEHKFEMQPGASMTYRWTATAPVYFDLHGDHFDDPENFTSAKIDTLAEDEGTYAAPFYGRHGWYFRNDGPAPVTITLETTGDYRILGAV